MGAGCASTPTHRVSLTGDIMVDGPRMIAEGPPRDKVLWQYRTAAAAMRRGQFDVAKPLLDDALLTLGGVYGKDAEARKARGLFNKEARKTFIGEPYERSMAYFYRGVLYWRDGELDNARACFRSAEFEDSDAENKEYKGDWVLPDYLDGLATTKLGGDGSDAFKRAKAVAKNINLPDYNPRRTCCSSWNTARGRRNTAAANTASNCAFARAVRRCCRRKSRRVRSICRSRHAMI
jgi:tetratricopeptide (TPR) repeat protein